MSEVNQDTLSVYKEKNWGKDQNGEYTIDGYTFKGKRAFRKALEGLKAKLTKGVVDEVNGIQIKVLDSRKNGTAQDIEIECVKNSNRGIAVLKLYGPSSKKKQNVVMVTKSKESDSKYVTMLAQSVIKPLIDKFLGGTDKKPYDKKTVNSILVRGKEVRLVKCPFCEKTSYSAPGMKGHITKMHKDIVVSDAIDIDGHDEEVKDMKMKSGEIFEEANKVIELLIDGVDNNVDENEELIEEVKEPALDETLGEMNESFSKRYYNECDKCDFVADASRRYTALQMLKEHRRSCCGSHGLTSEARVSAQCDRCDFAVKDSVGMKRHMRDIHKIKTVSTSPPPKKVRLSVFENFDEPMDIEDEKVLDLSASFEEMEVSDLENEKDILKEKSRLMDKKIEEQRKRNEENENSWKNKEYEEEHKKRIEEEKKTEQSRKKNKKRKQNLKDNKKVENKKSKKNERVRKIPNIKDIPENCKHLVNKGDVLYEVPGDGCCAPNCASAFLFGDEVFGPKLRRRMNIFMAKHWSVRYKYITQCSPDHPFERRHRDGKISYTDPEELLKFLTTSKKSAYMWSDSEDLAIISDMYQITIKVITTKGKDDENPTVNWITPDTTLKDFAELKDVDIGVMVLLHENDCHFNLIVSDESDLANLGSLSYRFNVGPTITIDDTIEDEDETELYVPEPQKMDSNILDLQKELKKCRESKNLIEKEYKKCEKELRNKTEEAEILKVEVKDLKEILKLKDECAVKGVQDDAAISQNWTRKRNGQKSQQELPKENLFNCKNCEFKTSTKSKLVSHVEMMHGHRKEEQFNCRECDFQTTNNILLNKHFSLKHRAKEGKLEEEIKCRNCGEIFAQRWKLMTHRKQKHSNTVALCKNNLLKKCIFSAELCWWNHNKSKDENIERIECFICNDTFETKTKMMVHRKNNHTNFVGKCNNFLQNNCKFEDQFCWFLHDEATMETETSENVTGTSENVTGTSENVTETSENVTETSENIAEKDNFASVFQKSQKIQKPPLQTKVEKQKTD